MIDEIQNELVRFLPLIIECINWDDPTLYCCGPGWSFSTTTSWRIVDGTRLILGCNQEDISGIINEIKNFQIIAVNAQSIDLPLDIVFTLSNGYRLEIFSTTGYDPWAFRIPTGEIYDGPLKVDKDSLSDRNLKISTYEEQAIIPKFYQIIEDLLPLDMEVANYRQNILNLSGKDWMFSTTSSWRFIDRDNFLSGCSDRYAQDVIKKIEHGQIVRVTVQTFNFPVDLVLHFSTGYRLEIFSDQPQQSWTFRLPKGEIMVGSPGDLTWIANFCS